MNQNVKDLFKNWKTVPNLLSLLRILMVPIMAVLFVKGYPIWAVFVLFLSGVSDFLDGKIARRFNQISDLGKILDPVADKATQITVAVLLFLFFRSAQNSPELTAFSWVFLLFVGKELLMVLISIVLLAMGLRPGAAEIWGKVATFVFYTVMVFIIAFGPEIVPHLLDGAGLAAADPCVDLRCAVLCGTAQLCPRNLQTHQEQKAEIIKEFSQ